jgi:hypothetical protein
MVLVHLHIFDKQITRIPCGIGFGQVVQCEHDAVNHPAADDTHDAG